MEKWPKWLPLALVLTAMVVGLMLMSEKPAAVPPPEIAYSEFKSLLAKGEIAEVILHDKAVAGTLKRTAPLGPKGAETTRFLTRIPAFGDPELLPALEKAKVTLKVAKPVTGGFGSVLLALAPWVLFFGVYWWFWTRASRNMAGGMHGGMHGGIGKFLEGSSKVESGERPNVTFDDVAGQESAKREVSELLDYLRDPERYGKLGAEVPHGVLLMGPPGIGKTLLARALAGEADVPFFHISASEFIEVFVGVGAGRVRRMFAEAKQRAPSIIFIDEIDSIGRVRGTGLGGGHDEREQTLNQILAEMDGFEGHEAVVVLAATNRPDVLDPALLRPGRFDRHVTLDLPDKRAREAILKVHIRDVPLAADVDLGLIANGTPGFSGADLKNLVNEAAMLAARDGAAKVTARHFDETRDKLIMGSVRRLAIEPEEHYRLAAHEAGHTAVAYFLPNADPLYKVTIIPRGQALGSTHQLPEAERHILPEEYLRDRLSVMLGGRTAEKVFLDSVSSGADDDIRQATALARTMVGRWGMSEKIGPVDLRESQDHPFLGLEIAQPRRFSEMTAHNVDEAVRALLLDAEKRAAEALRGHRAKVERLISELEKHETLNREEIEACLGALHPKKKRRTAARRA